MFVITFVYYGIINNIALAKPIEESPSGCSMMRISRPKTDAIRMPFSLGEDPVFARLFMHSEMNEGNSILSDFQLWRKQFTTPSICPMVLCHGSCCKYDDSCPSFSGLSVLDLKHLGQILQYSCCAVACRDTSKSMVCQP